MKWERDGSWWVAKGKDGAFYVRKKNYYYRAHYLTYGTRQVIWFTKSERLTEAKRKCEYNWRWETEKIKRK